MFTNPIEFANKKNPQLDVKSVSVEYKIPEQKKDNRAVKLLPNSPTSYTLPSVPEAKVPQDMVETELAVTPTNPSIQSKLQYHHDIFNFKDNRKLPDGLISIPGLKQGEELFDDTLYYPPYYSVGSTKRPNYDCEDNEELKRVSQLFNPDQHITKQSYYDKRHDCNVDITILDPNKFQEFQSILNSQTTNENTSSEKETWNRIFKSFECSDHVSPTNNALGIGSIVGKGQFSNLIQIANIRYEHYGFDMNAYLDVSDHRIYFAFKGSKEWQQWLIDDYQLVFNGKPGSAKANYVQEGIKLIIEAYSKFLSDITFTGHSLGAALATWYSSLFQKEAFCFDNPGIGKKYPIDDSKVTSFQSTPNVVNRVNTQQGNVFQLAPHNSVLPIMQDSMPNIDAGIGLIGHTKDYIRASLDRTFRLLYDHSSNTQLTQLMLIGSSLIYHNEAAMILSSQLESIYIPRDFKNDELFTSFLKDTIGKKQYNSEKTNQALKEISEPIKKQRALALKIQSRASEIWDIENPIERANQAKALLESQDFRKYQKYRSKNRGELKRCRDKLKIKDKDDREKFNNFIALGYVYDQSETILKAMTLSTLPQILEEMKRNPKKYENFFSEWARHFLDFSNFSLTSLENCIAYNALRILSYEGTPFEEKRAFILGLYEMWPLPELGEIFAYLEIDAFNEAMQGVDPRSQMYRIELEKLISRLEEKLTSDSKSLQKTILVYQAIEYYCKQEWVESIGLGVQFVNRFIELVLVFNDNFKPTSASRKILGTMEAVPDLLLFIANEYRLCVLETNLKNMLLDNPSNTEASTFLDLLENFWSRLIYDTESVISLIALGNFPLKLFSIYLENKKLKNISQFVSHSSSLLLHGKICWDIYNSDKFLTPTNLLKFSVSTIHTIENSLLLLGILSRFNYYLSDGIIKQTLQNFDYYCSMYVNAKYSNRIFMVGDFILLSETLLSKVFDLSLLGMAIPEPITLGYRILSLSYGLAAFSATAYAESYITELLEGIKNQESSKMMVQKFRNADDYISNGWFPYIFMSYDDKNNLIRKGYAFTVMATNQLAENFSREFLKSFSDKNQPKSLAELRVQHRKITAFLNEEDHSYFLFQEKNEELNLIKSIYELYLLDTIERYESIIENFNSCIRNFNTSNYFLAFQLGFHTLSVQRNKLETITQNHPHLEGIFKTLNLPLVIHNWDSCSYARNVRRLFKGLLKRLAESKSEISIGNDDVKILDTYIKNLRTKNQARKIPIYLPGSIKPILSRVLNVQSDQMQEDSNKQASSQNYLALQLIINEISNAQESNDLSEKWRLSHCFLEYANIFYLNEKHREVINDQKKELMRVIEFEKNMKMLVTPFFIEIMLRFGMLGLDITQLMNHSKLINLAFNMLNVMQDLNYFYAFSAPVNGDDFYNISTRIKYILGAVNNDDSQTKVTLSWKSLALIVPILRSVHRLLEEIYLYGFELTQDRKNINTDHNLLKYSWKVSGSILEVIEAGFLAEQLLTLVLGPKYELTFATIMTKETLENMTRHFDEISSGSLYLATLLARLHLNYSHMSPLALAIASNKLIPKIILFKNATGLGKFFITCSPIVMTTPFRSAYISFTTETLLCLDKLGFVTMGKMVAAYFSYVTIPLLVSSIVYNYMHYLEINKIHEDFKKINQLLDSGDYTNAQQLINNQCQIAYNKSVFEILSWLPDWVRWLFDYIYDYEQKTKEFEKANLNCLLFKAKKNYLVGEDLEKTFNRILYHVQSVRVEYENDDPTIPLLSVAMKILEKFQVEGMSSYSSMLSHLTTSFIEKRFKDKSNLVAHNRALVILYGNFHKNFVKARELCHLNQVLEPEEVSHLLQECGIDQADLYERLIAIQSILPEFDKEKNDKIYNKIKQQIVAAKQIKNHCNIDSFIVRKDADEKERFIRERKDYDANLHKLHIELDRNAFIFRYLSGEYKDLFWDLVKYLSFIDSTYFEVYNFNPFVVIAALIINKIYFEEITNQLHDRVLSKTSAHELINVLRSNDLEKQFDSETLQRIFLLINSRYLEDFMAARDNLESLRKIGPLSEDSAISECELSCLEIQQGLKTISNDLSNKVHQREILLKLNSFDPINEFCLRVKKESYDQFPIQTNSDFIRQCHNVNYVQKYYFEMLLKQSLSQDLEVQTGILKNIFNFLEGQTLLVPSDEQRYGLLELSYVILDSISNPESVYRTIRYAEKLEKFLEQSNQTNPKTNAISAILQFRWFKNLSKAEYFINQALQNNAQDQFYLKISKQIEYQKSRILLLMIDFGYLCYRGFGTNLGASLKLSHDGIFNYCISLVYESLFHYLLEKQFLYHRFIVGEITVDDVNMHLGAINLFRDINFIFRISRLTCSYLEMILRLGSEHEKNHSRKKLYLHNAVLLFGNFIEIYFLKQSLNSLYFKSMANEIDLFGILPPLFYSTVSTINISSKLVSLCTNNYGLPQSPRSKLMLHLYNKGLYNLNSGSLFSYASRYMTLYGFYQLYPDITDILATTMKTYVPVMMQNYFEMINTVLYEGIHSAARNFWEVVGDSFTEYLTPNYSLTATAFVFAKWCVSPISASILGLACMSFFTYKTYCFIQHEKMELSFREDLIKTEALLQNQEYEKVKTNLVILTKQSYATCLPYKLNIINIKAQLCFANFEKLDSVLYREIDELILEYSKDKDICDYLMALYVYLFDKVTDLINEIDSNIFVKCVAQVMHFATRIENTKFFNQNIKLIILKSSSQLLCLDKLDHESKNKIEKYIYSYFKLSKASSADETERDVSQVLKQFKEDVPLACIPKMSFNPQGQSQLVKDEAAISIFNKTTQGFFNHNKVERVQQCIIQRNLYVKNFKT